jgi:hypothetical protein
MPSRCPPGAVCLSTGLTHTLVALLAVSAMFFLGAWLFPRIVAVPSPASPSPLPSPHPSTVVNVQGGDSRYQHAPQPLRDWRAPPEFPPRGGLSALPFNQPTQGLPETFQSVGLIKVDNQMLPLYGRRTAGSTDRWNYYTRTDTYNPIPLPIQIQRRDCMDDVGCPEVSTGDRVRVRGLQKEGETEIYRFDGPKYLPGY